MSFSTKYKFETSCNIKPSTHLHTLKTNIFKNKIKEVRNLIRNAKTNYYNMEFTKYKNDIKKTWQTIDDVINNSTIFSKTPEYFNISGDQIKNKKDIANHFNNFFINIGSKITKI